MRADVAAGLATVWAIPRANALIIFSLKVAIVIRLS